MRRAGPEFECILAVAVALLVTISLCLLPKRLQLPASVVLAWAIFAAGVHPRFRASRR